MKNCFRPHQGIILFNATCRRECMRNRLDYCFRPHQGIILFNALGAQALWSSILRVSVPIRGLFYLTR